MLRLMRRCAGPLARFLGRYLLGFKISLVRGCVLYVTPLGNSHDWLENPPFSIGNTSIPIHSWWMFVCQSWGVGFVGYFKIPIFKVRRNLGSHNYAQQQWPKIT